MADIAAVARAGHRPLTLREAVGQRLLWVFPGPSPTDEVLAAIRSGECAGVVLYHYLNVVSPAQVRDLCAALQAARPAGDPPLLIATDQEGGQLQAIGEGATAWPGNLALGAAGSPELARRAGEAIGRECAALGVNYDFAPVCDVANDPTNPVIGTRACGDDPAAVGELVAAFVEGLQAAGVAGSAKHFPGHGAARGDSHTGLPVIERSPGDLAEIELRPFRAAIDAGVASVMISHLAVPSVDDGLIRPATVSPLIVRRLLRAAPAEGGLGYEGVIVSDALDMGGLGVPGGMPAIAVAAAGAGIDLFTPGPLQAADPTALARVPDALLEAAEAGVLDPAEMVAAAERVLALRSSLPPAAPALSLDVLDCPDHRALASEIARGSLTLVRDPRHLLPIPADAGPIVTVVPRPADLTPADTSSLVRIDLPAALAAVGRAATGIEIAMDPGDDEIARVIAEAQAALDDGSAGSGGRVVVATIDACSHPGQVRLVDRLVRAGLPVVVAVLRSPHDAAIVGADAAVICAYSIQPPTIEALASALAGEAGFPGRLPVTPAAVDA